jgi:hypothetical protein
MEQLETNLLHAKTRIVLADRIAEVRRQLEYVSEPAEIIRVQGFLAGLRFAQNLTSETYERAINELNEAEGSSSDPEGSAEVEPDAADREKQRRRGDREEPNRPTNTTGIPHPTLPILSGLGAPTFSPGTGGGVVS